MQNTETNHETLIVFVNERGDFLTDFTFTGKPDENKINGTNSITSVLSIYTGEHLVEDEIKVIEMAKILGFYPKVVEISYDLKDFEINDYEVKSKAEIRGSLDTFF